MGGNILMSLEAAGRIIAKSFLYLVLAAFGGGFTWGSALLRY